MRGQQEAVAAAAGRSRATEGAAIPWRWYAALAAGLFPALVLGFAASALANRLVFLGWAAATAAGYALLLRLSWESWRRRGGPAVPALLWLAGAAVWLGALVARHGESLDLGYRALLWPHYLPAATRAESYWLLAVALAIGALLALWRGR
jgi:hypothetical protein